jgi:methionyl-tRNA formyltransferase
MANLAFFGTPHFALPALRVLSEYSSKHGHTLKMVITKPDIAQGRGLKESAPPIKILAQTLGHPVLQPETLRKDTPEGTRFFSEFKEAQIDLAIVVAYGKIIPGRFLSAVSRNFVNIHASLLPRFRGAAPIQHAILSGDTKTGVCLMEVVQKLDEGDIFACRETPIIMSDTSGTLFRRLSHLGADLLRDRLQALIAGTEVKKAQDLAGVTYAPMIEKSAGAISFDASASFIAAQVRAYDPWPTAYACINNKRVQFFDSFYINTNLELKVSPGTIVSVNPFLGVKAQDGIVYFQTIQVEGKKALPVKEALKGFNLKIGDKIKIFAS